MRKKQKTFANAIHRATNRRQFEWFFRRPFRFEFDRSHWWEDEEHKSEITPSAALYELARRHPRVRDEWVRRFAVAQRTRRGVAVWHTGIRERWTQKIMRNDSATVIPTSLYWTCFVGLSSWIKLDWTDRGNWEFSVGFLKGLDYRPPDHQCRDIVQRAKSRVVDKRRENLKTAVDAADEDELMQRVREDLGRNPPSASEWEAAIAEEAIAAFRAGHILFSATADLRSETADSLLGAKYREHFKFFRRSKPVQRARWQDWLPLIGNFEEAVTSENRVTAQDFVRYRRAIDGIRFD